MASLLRSKACMLVVCFCPSLFCCTWGPLHTWAWRFVTNAFSNLSLVQKAENVQVHFTLEGEGLRARAITMDEKSTGIPTWQIMDNVSCSTKICIEPTSKRLAWHKFQQTMLESRTLDSWYSLWMTHHFPNTLSTLLLLVILSIMHMWVLHYIIEIKCVWGAHQVKCCIYMRYPT